MKEVLLRLIQLADDNMHYVVILAFVLGMPLCLALASIFGVK